MMWESEKGIQMFRKSNKAGTGKALTVPEAFDAEAAVVAAICRSQAVIEFDLDGRILTANANFLDLMGYSLHEVVGQHHRIFVDPEERAGAAYADFWRRLRAGEFFVAEFARINKDGQRIWIQGSYNPLLDVDGTPVKIMKFATDITASKLKSADHNGQIEAIGLTQAVITFQMDGTILSANPLFCEAVGYSEGEIVGKHHSMFVLPEERGGDAYAKFWQALNHGECQAGEFCRVGRTGQRIWLQASYTPIMDDRGLPFKVVKYATNITTAVQQRQKFNLLSLVADGTDNSVVITDHNKRIIYANSGFERLTGYRAADVIGKSPGQFLQGRGTDPVTVARVREKLAAGEPFYDEILNYTKSGEPYWISLSINPVRDSHGRIEKFISVQANVTETKAAALYSDSKLDAIGASAAMVEWDVEGQCKSLNPFLANRPTRPLSTILNVNQVERVKRNEFVRAEVAWPDSKGSELWLDATFSALVDLEGHVERILMVGIDITPRRRAVQETSSAMQDMLDNVTATVVKIDQIASMTNLLAFNAAVEAGRAAAAGGGFKVVAEEVRKLAMQAGNAAAEINVLIEQSRGQIARLGATDDPVQPHIKARLAA